MDKDKKFCSPCVSKAIVEIGKDVCSITKGKEQKSCNKLISYIDENSNNLSIEKAGKAAKLLGDISKKNKFKDGILGMKVIKDLIDNYEKE